MVSKVRILDIFEEGIEYSNLEGLELVGIYRIVGSCTWGFLIYRLNFGFFILFFVDGECYFIAFFHRVGVIHLASVKVRRCKV